MRRFNILMFFSLMAVTMNAQFINNGATVTIQSGATLRVETDFQNNGTGTITNNGVIEVSGNFTNAGTATLTPAVGTVKFIGTANTTLNTGGDALNNVEMAKTSNATVSLAAPASIGGNLSFTGTGSKIVLGANDLTLASASTVTTPGANGYVVTDGAGGLVKGITANNSAFLMEVGDATNYSPVSNNVTGTYSSSTLKARVYTSGLQPKYGDASDYINREWNVVANNISSYTNTITGTYVAGDVVGTQALIKGATYHTGDWRFDGSAGSGSTVTASTTNADVKLSGMNFYGKVNLQAYLAGALSGGSMTTTLNSILPLTTPYTASPFNAPTVTAPSIPATATDWILVEVRDPSTPATLISQTSAFILSNGTIVGIDGNSLKLKNAVASAHIGLKHRNHLPIRTDSPIDLVNPPVIKNFSLGTSEAYTNPSITTNANMRLVGSVYAMWSGNTNSNNNVRYLGPSNDNSALLSALGGVAGNVYTQHY